MYLNDYVNITMYTCSIFSFSVALPHYTINSVREELYLICFYNFSSSKNVGNEKHYQKYHSINKCICVRICPNAENILNTGSYIM